MDFFFIFKIVIYCHVEGVVTQYPSLPSAGGGEPPRVELTISHVSRAAMKLRNFLSCAFDICQSEKKVYHNADGSATQDNICFLTFDEDQQMDGVSADFAVCSHAVQQNLAKCKDDAERVAFLADCTIEVNDMGEEPQLAVKMPNSAKRLASGLHF